MLSGHEIVEQMRKGNIVIEPFIAEHVGPNSVDLRLARELKVYNVFGSKYLKIRDRLDPPYDEPAIVNELDMKKKNPTLDLVIPEEGFVLLPGHLYLGSTLEWTETRGFVPHIDGRSSIGRLGCSIHETAGRGDTGFRGRWTLELTVIHPLRVYFGARICQIWYQEVTGKETTYRGKYQDQSEPGASKLFRDFELPAEPAAPPVPAEPSAPPSPYVPCCKCGRNNYRVDFDADEMLCPKCRISQSGRPLPKRRKI